MVTARTLAAAVQVGTDFYPAGSRPPAEVAKLITNPNVWAPADTDGEDGGDGTGAGSSSSSTPAKKKTTKQAAKPAASPTAKTPAEPKTDPEGDAQGEADGENGDGQKVDGETDGQGTDPGAGEKGEGALSEPPRSGKGSGLPAWKAYAESLGLEVPGDAQRDDVMTLVDLHDADSDDDDSSED